MKTKLVKLVWMLFIFWAMLGSAHAQGNAPGSDIAVPSIIPTPVTLAMGATPKISGRANYITSNNAPTTITNFLNGTPGQNIQIFCGDSTTSIVSGVNILLSDTWSCPDSVSIELTRIGTVWTETGRFGTGGGGGMGTVSPGTTNNLAVYTGSTTVGSSTLPAAQVPLKNTTNTFTNSQTFSSDPLFGSGVPWTDVRTKSAVCNGTTDSTTGITATFTSLAPMGGTAFLPDNCNYNPPTTLPASGSGFYSPIINLGGMLNLTNPLHLNNYYQTVCQTPAMRSPANFGAPVALSILCPIVPYPTAFTVSPLVSEESNAFVLKDLYLNLFCGSGLKNLSYWQR